MKRLMILALTVVLMASASDVWATMITYAIVDYPAYQVDTVTGLTDHVSGTITADPATGDIASASFTITGTTSYTVASATTDSNTFIHVTPTEITLTQNNPLNPLNYGNLRLSGSTGVSGANSTAVLDWYTPGDPWVVGSNNWPGYTGTVGGHGSGPGFSSTGLGAYPWVVATAVPEPGTLVLLATGGLGLLAYAWRRRRS